MKDRTNTVEKASLAANRIGLNTWDGVEALDVSDWQAAQRRLTRFSRGLNFEVSGMTMLRTFFVAGMLLVSTYLMAQPPVDPGCETYQAWQSQANGRTDAAGINNHASPEANATYWATVLKSP